MENKFVRVVPSNNADADPSSSCVRDYSCLSSMTAGKRKQIGIRSSRLVLPRTALPRTSSNPGQNKTPAPILVSSPRMATHNVPERASSQIEKLSTRTNLRIEKQNKSSARGQGRRRLLPDPQRQRGHHLRQGLRGGGDN